MCVDTLSGVKELELAPGPDGAIERVSVCMGRAEVEPERVVEALGEKVRLTPVDVGNPHAVVFTEDALAAPVATLGAALRTSRGVSRRGQRRVRRGDGRKRAAHARVGAR